MTGAGPPAAVRIEDPDDGRLADYRHLNDARRRREMEAPDPQAGRPGYFVAEGLTVVSRLFGSGRPVRSVLVDPTRLARLPPPPPGAEVYVAEPAVLRAVAGFDVHRGALAAADRWPRPDPGSLLAGARRVALLEGVNDHENLGVVFRSAAGLGIEAVLLDERCCDPFYRRSVRVSMGHVLTVPWARLTPWPARLDLLAAAGFTLFALTPAEDALDLGSLGALPERVAVLLGAEGPGLSPAALGRADHRVRIPMAAGVDSLNLASAAGVAFWALRAPS